MRQLIKNSGNVPNVSFSNVDENNAYYNRLALGSVGKMTLLGLALAGGIRGLSELQKGMKLIKSEKRKSTEEPVVITMPVVKQGANYDPRNVDPVDRFLRDTLTSIVDTGARGLLSGVNAVQAVKSKLDSVGGSVARTAQNLTTKTPEPDGRYAGLRDIWWHRPAQIGGLVGGVYFGNKAMAALAANLRERKVQREVEKAKEEYKAILAASSTKSASVIDVLAEKFVKASDDEFKPGVLDNILSTISGVKAPIPFVGDIPLSGHGLSSRALSAYILLGAPLAAYTAHRVYEKQLKQHPDYIKQKALEEYKSRFKLQPPEVRVEVKKPDDTASSE